MHMENTFFFPADAHEGPVWVDWQRRLYYATKTHLQGRRRVDIEYLDFSALPGDDIWLALRQHPDFRPTPQCFLQDARMANGMRLSEDGQSLLVAEQGYGEEPAAVAMLSLADKTRRVLVDNYAGTPFNSINKVIRSRRGHLIFSDPDYGFRQGFKPPTVLEPNLYIHTAAGNLNCFRCGLEMPHGLALSPDEQVLFVSDTSNEGGHAADIQLSRRKSVWKYRFNADTGAVSCPGICCFEVKEGAPDGMLTTADRLLVGGGDGVYVADLEGNLKGTIPTPNSAVNLTTAAEDQHLFITIDDGVVLCLDWQEEVIPINGK